MSEAAEITPTLGEILSAARLQSAAFADWLLHNDPLLHARLDATLGPDDSHSGQIREAVGAFVQSAADEDWVRLVSAVRDGDSPGLAALHVMLDWALAQGQAG